VFGAADDPCRAGMVAALDRANTIDLFGFIPVYGLFLAAFLLAAMRTGGGRAAGAGLFFLVAGLAFDTFETAIQLRITGALPGSDANLMALVVGSRGKFSLLALVSLFAGLAMLTRGGLLGRLAGLGCIVSAGLTFAGLAAPSAASMLPGGIALAWTLMLVYAVVEAIRPTRSGRHARLA
jgi:hypothetical protein